MVKEIAAVFVAGPPVVERLGEPRTKQELGGWQIQLQCGAVDHAVDTEDQAFEATRRFLSYLPSSIHDLPPRVRGWDNPNRRDESLISVIPKAKKQAYHMRRIIGALFDKDSFFEMGALFGRSIITGFARLDGWPVAVMAGDPLFDGGAWTADACSKIVRFVDMAQTFHLPVVHLVDCPGFQVGLRAESTAVIRWGVRALSAINQTTVPWCSIVVRNCYGVGGLGHQPVGRLCLRYAWPSASWGSLPLEGGIEAAYRAEIDAAPDPDAEAGGNRGAAEPPALAAAHGRGILGGRGDRSAGHAPAAVRFRQPGGTAAHAGAEHVRDAAVGQRTRASRKGPEPSPLHYRHGSACPSHPHLHVPRQMARTSRIGARVASARACSWKRLQLFVFASIFTRSRSDASGICSNIRSIGRSRSHCVMAGLGPASHDWRC
jgi:hypothetical protein